MSLQYFSQFLLLEGAISEDQLQQAIAAANVSHSTLGQLAVAAGYMTEEQANELNQEQLKQDKRFGDLATERGYLSDNQLGEIVTNQGQQHIRLGEATVKLGFLNQEQLDSLFARFADTKNSDASDPRDLLKELGTFGETKAVHFIADSFPRLTMRLSHIHLKIKEGTSSTDSSLRSHTASIDLKGPSGLCISLSTDKNFADAIMRGMTRIMSGDPDFEEDTNEEIDLADVLGGFLDIIAGQAVSNLESQGLAFEVGTPRYGEIPEGGFAFDISNTTGLATIVLTPL